MKKHPKGAFLGLWVRLKIVSALLKRAKICKRSDRKGVEYISEKFKLKLKTVR